MKLEILGTGCTRCKKLEQLTKEAVLELGIGATASVSKVEKLEDIIKYGVMLTPALAIDSKVVVAGRVPTKEEIKKFISGTSGKQEESCGGDCGCCCG